MLISYHLSLLQSPRRVSLTFFVFDDLTVLRSSGQISCRMRLTGICHD